VILPSPLKPGDRVAVVAPSGPFDRAAVEAGIAWLEQRYRVLRRASLFEKDGFLAGSDRRRATELQRALDDDVQAIVAARGGYGLSRIAHQLDFTSALERPRWLVGFSDFTVMHVEAWRRGLCSVHGSMVGSLGTADETVRSQWATTLEYPREAATWRGLSPWRKGRATGPLVGGNLAMLHACAAAGRLKIPRGAVVLLEDVGERPYRVDRMVTNLMTGGHLARASAVLVGHFTDCDSGPNQRTVDDVLKERLRTLGVPVLAEVPVGHGERNDAVVLGRRAEVDAARGVLTLG
jgi:muramoyltetrapeptide carboxypeptidase